MTTKTAALVVLALYMAGVAAMFGPPAVAAAQAAVGARIFGL